MRFVVMAVLLNIVFDPLFIAGLNLGIEGAAYATILAQGSAFLYGLIYVLRYKLVPFRIPSLPSGSEVRLILKLGIPSGLQMSVISAGSAASMSVVTLFGGSVVAGFGAGQRLGTVMLWVAAGVGRAVGSS